MTSKECCKRAGHPQGPRRLARVSWLALITLLGLAWVPSCNGSGGGAVTPPSGGAPGNGGGRGDGSGGSTVISGTGRGGAGGATAEGVGGNVGQGGVQSSGGTSTGGVLSVGGAAAGGRAAGGTMGMGGRGGAPDGGLGPDASAGGTAAGGGTGMGGASTGGSQSTGGMAGSVDGSTTGGVQGSGGAAGGTTGNPNDLWIATTGSDSNPGTEAQPFKTLAYAHSKASAGATIWIKPGTYAWDTTVSLSKSGTATSPINVFAAAGARPVLDFSAQPRDDSSARGIKISGDYWHIKGIDVINAGDNCIAISGGHNTLEWVTVHGCCDTGIQISADSSQASDATRAAYNTILNCDSYENLDQTTGGENADGFAAKLHIGPGNVFKGCRSWNNADDGWDLFASDDIVTFDNCWAFLNGKLANGGGTSNGDGNGFKLGGAAAAGDAYEGGAPHKLTNCFAFENLACGFTRNNNTEVPVLSSCGGRGDGKGEYCSLGTPSPVVSFTMTSAQAKATQRDASGNLPAIK